MNQGRNLWQIQWYLYIRVLQTQKQNRQTFPYQLEKPNCLYRFLFWLIRLFFLLPLITVIMNTNVKSITSFILNRKKTHWFTSCSLIWIPPAEDSLGFHTGVSHLVWRPSWDAQQESHLRKKMVCSFNPDSTNQWDTSQQFI